MHDLQIVLQAYFFKDASLLVYVVEVGLGIFQDATISAYVVYGSHKPYLWVYEMFKVWIQFGVEREWVLKRI